MAEEEPPSGWTMDIFRPFVESTLDEWKNDLLFVEIGLGATDAILSETENVPGKGDKDHPFNKILNWIAKKVSKQYKLDKKTKKTMTIMLRNQSDELTTIIRARQNTSPVKKQVAATQQESGAETEHEPQGIEVKSESQEIDVKEETIEHPIEHTDQRVEEINVDLSPRQLQMKEEFEKKKQEILGSLPDEVKARFGQQYFSKWGKNPLPVLVLSPYSVPPGGVRDMWFEMYEKVKQQDRLESATNLVYWYGAYDDPQNAYSFVVTKSLTPHETGIKKNMNKIPNAVQKKLDAGKKLTSSEKMQVEGLVEMEEDRSKEPDERHGRMVQAFLEDWEMTEELEEVVEPEEAPGKKPKAKSKPKKLKKRKKEAEEAEAKPKKQKKSKKTNEPKCEVEEKKPNEVEAEPKKDEATMTTAKVGDIGDIGDDDLSSHEDKDDMEDAEPPTESDEDDEDFEYANEPKKKPKTQTKKPKGAKVAPKKKAQKSKRKLEKGRQEGRKKAPEGQRQRNSEQSRFTDCENKYLKILDDWKYGVENHSKGTIKEIYVRLLDCVAKFSAPFIEAYEMPALMKRSKRIVDDENRLKLWKTMKDVYEKKKKDVPSGFVPQKQERDNPKTEIDDKAKQVSSVGDPTESVKVATKIPTKTKVEIQDPPSTPTKQATPAATTEKKRKFSLGSMITKPKPTSKPASTPAAGLNRSTSSSQLSKRQSNPQWMSETSIKDPPKDENRAFALEFLQQATPFIPQNDKVKADVVARELEASIFEWAGGKEDTVVTDSFVKYWDKVDDMVAAISGDGGNGTIAKMISEGGFKSASDVVRLSENDIALSYERKPLEDFPNLKK